MSTTTATQTPQPANRLFGPLWSTAGLLALPMPWLRRTVPAAAVSGWPVVNGLSAGLVGIFSALLWVHAAWQPDDTLSNAAAACCSGATALFSTGTISFSETLPHQLRRSPRPRSLRFGLGGVVVTA